MRGVLLARERSGPHLLGASTSDNRLSSHHVCSHHCPQARSAVQAPCSGCHGGNLVKNRASAARTMPGAPQLHLKTQRFGTGELSAGTRLWGGVRAPGVQPQHERLPAAQRAPRAWSCTAPVNRPARDPSLKQCLRRFLLRNREQLPHAPGAVQHASRVGGAAAAATCGVISGRACAVP
jgi:hypothetical protein